MLQESTHHAPRDGDRRQDEQYGLGFQEATEVPLAASRNDVQSFRFFDPTANAQIVAAKRLGLQTPIDSAKTLLATAITRSVTSTLARSASFGMIGAIEHRRCVLNDEFDQRYPHFVANQPVNG